MRLLQATLQALPLGERHDYADNNPDFQGLASVGNVGLGAPNQQRWSAPIARPQSGLTQGEGRSPGWEWPSMPVTLHENPQFADRGGSKHPAAVAEPKPEYHGWTAPSYRQQFETRPRPGGISAVNLRQHPALPFGANRTLGGEAGPSGTFAGRYREVNVPDVEVPA